MNPRGIVTLVFDDGYQHILDDIVPLLDQHQVPAVFAVPLDSSTIVEETGLPLADAATWIHKLQSTNHELAAHSVSHRDLTTLVPAELDTELKQPAQTLSATTLIYPGGGHNQAVVSAAKHHYQAARTVIKGFNAVPPADPMRLKTHNFTQDNFSVTKANLLALYAYLSNSWLIETYHIVTNDASPQTHAVSLEGFQKHLQFLATLPIKKQTIQDVISNNKHSH